ncbi:MAG TPA: acylphosphatase [bacterium]|nr:acylphosphatase [bacterium]HOL47730.1 acylphosphatase [bacterium]HPQ18036.1 acylphosphatase [bacterium]
MEKTLLIKVFGEVQGVGFRYFTVNVAKQLGVTGTVKNLFNGNVEIKARAEESVLNEFIKYIQKGPMLARVEKLDIQEINEQDFDGFKIRY